MTPEQLQIEEFVKGQAGIGGGNIPGVIPVAAVRWTPGKFFWATLGCQDQSHLHVHAYDKLVAPHSVGVQVYLAGEVVAYVAPWPEWHDEVYDRVWLADTWAARDKALADPKLKQRFDEFFRDGVG